MKLVIVESPTKAKTINWYLKDEYKVVASNGHIRDLSINEGKFGIDIEKGFKPYYEELTRSKRVISYMKKLASDAEEILIATDPDREGEAIAWHIAEVLNLPDEKRKRLVFNEITKNAVLNSIDDFDKIDGDLVKSQETRRILDRIMGFELSSLLQKKIKARSAGRVQSTTLKLIVEREEEIKKFKEKITYSLDGKTKDFDFKLVNEKKEEIRKEKKESLDKIKKDLSSSLKIKDFSEEEKQKYPFPPFTTSTLQQDAFIKFKFSSSKTNKIAQKLYEGIKIKNRNKGLITYMRTDSIRVSPVFAFKGLDYIEQKWGKEYKGFARTSSKKSGKKIQDAHEAIRPTYVENTPEDIEQYLSKDEHKLYKLIWTRTMASLMKSAAYIEQNIILEKKENLFLAKGKKLTFDGYHKLFSIYEKSEYKNLDKYKEEKEVEVLDYETKEHKTKPPYRYSEGSIIKKMESEGIGRPSTYASTIEALLRSAYISKNRNFLVPTEKGYLAKQKLQDFFNEFINCEYTSKMEENLDKIAEGTFSKEETLGSFYENFTKKIKLAYENMEKKKDKKVGEKCPKCSGELIEEEGRYGKFICCENRPECDYIKPKEKKELEVIKKCPKCDDGNLVKRKGRYGYFLGCSNFPKCKHIEKIKK